MNLLEERRLWVRTLLSKPLGFDWSIQGFGMIRLYLSPNLRLHIWNSRGRVKNVSDIPVIEKEIKDLRAKINRKYKPKQRRKSKYKSIAGEIEKLKEEMERKKPSLYGVKKEIKELKEEAKKTEETSVK